ncbi:MAG: hypothetical protein OHK93_008419 [Ramalina farinacea]|uniref:Heterokaryon incompatibility domain-containing protein n=1 Tax=Ramalina farinacea TaxID=258253 RepID=A0AA43QMD7_9LECA|nr:hypothetical protein [Ramalina farinacea]
MHLLHTSRLELQEFIGDDIPKYAILSHTWGDQEVLFRHVWEKDFPPGASMGSRKIRNACALAVKDGWEYIWVDTCCINKESSAELSEAINAMYQWYKASEVCYVYLSDVSPSGKGLKESRWFTRGWTLQELLAPRLVKFYNQHWQYVASKDLRDEIWRDKAYMRSVADFYTTTQARKVPTPPVGRAPTFLAELAEVTCIAIPYLTRVSTASVAQKMSWLAERQTKRGEDTAYCMLGIFDVNMPLLYGEGKTKAFIRLQSEILKTTYDDSIFAWNNPDLWSSGLLASSPHDFINCGNIKSSAFEMGEVARRPPSLTSLGLEMEIPVADAQGFPARRDDFYSLPLECHRNGDSPRDCFYLNIQLYGRKDLRYGLIVAARKNVGKGRPEHHTLQGERKRQVYFPQTPSPKSSSWQSLTIGAISWPSADYGAALSPPPPPAVNFKLGHALLRHDARISFYQDLSHLGKGRRRIEVPKSTNVTLLPREEEKPCGLLLTVPYGSGFTKNRHILLRWLLDDDGQRTSSIEVSHLGEHDPDDLKSYRGHRLSSNEIRVLFPGENVEVGRKRNMFPIRSDLRPDPAMTLHSDKLFQGGVLAYELDPSAMHTIWVSFLDHQDHGDTAEWTVELDMTED